MTRCNAFPERRVLKSQGWEVSYMPQIARSPTLSGGDQACRGGAEWQISGSVGGVSEL